MTRTSLLVLALASALPTVGCDMSTSAGASTPTGPTSSSPTPAEATQIRGYVLDLAGRDLAGVRIEALDGPLIGAIATTTETGEFELTGTATGTVNLKARKEGFASETKQASWHPAGSMTIEVFKLEVLEPPFPIEPGIYAVTVTNHVATARDLAAPCAGFPVDLVSRTYAATIAADPGHPGTFFGVTVNGTGFGLGVTGADVGFTIDGPAIVETLPGFRYLWITGNAPTTERPSVNGSVTTIPFAGSFEYCQLKSAMPGGRNCFTTPATDRIDYHQCWSSHDTMAFTKR